LSALFPGMNSKNLLSAVLAVATDFFERLNSIR